jgi:hypothetical protein
MTDPAGGAAPVVRAFGDRAWLVEPDGAARPSTEWVLAMAEAARGLWPDALVVPGLASVLVSLAAPPGRPAARAQLLREALAGAVPRVVEAGRSDGSGVGGGAPSGAPGGPGRAVREHRIPTRYDGPDLAGLAAALGMPVAELVARHVAATWTVAAIGFSPGFGYLTCDDPLFGAIPRRSDPRPRVPPGAVALAAGMCAVYPSASPGGWQLVGTTDVRLFDATLEPPALLSVGDVVRFEVAP